MNELEGTLASMYIYISYVIPYIKTIYLAACSQKLFAETILLFANCMLRHAAAELCFRQRREVESQERVYV